MFKLKKMAQPPCPRETRHSARGSRQANYGRLLVSSGEKRSCERFWAQELALDRSGSLGRAAFSNRKGCEASERHCAGGYCARPAVSSDVDDRSGHHTRLRRRGLAFRARVGWRASHRLVNARATIRVFSGPGISH